MSDTTTTPFSIETLTLFEIETIEDVIGMPFSEAGEKGLLSLPYAIYWVNGMREDPGLEWQTVKGLPMSDITAITDGMQDTPLA